MIGKPWRLPLVSPHLAAALKKSIGHLDDMVVVQPKDAEEAGDYRVMPYREFLSRAADFHLCPDVKPEDLE